MKKLSCIKPRPLTITNAAAAKARAERAMAEWRSLHYDLRPGYDTLARALSVARPR